MNKQEIEQYKQIGKVSKEIREYAKKIIKPGMLLIEIADAIEKKINEMGVECAFPVNLSIDDLAAHYHPVPDEKTVASGLLKVDIGIHKDGFIADNAISIDLTEKKEHKKLIETAEAALENALQLLKKNPTLHEIGLTIQNTIEKNNFSPVINLSGHSIEKYKVHAGTTIPNYGNNSKQTLKPGVYAIEPFVTYGEGKIYEGNNGNIYSVIEFKGTRSPTARKILDYVEKKYKTMPFSYREIFKNFGPLSRLALRELENQKIIRSYAQLIESSHKPVAQAEHTFLKTEDGEIIVITR